MAQQLVLATILESFPVAELTDEQAQTFLAIKRQILSSADAQEELKTLYKVNGFSDFAAGLLWVVDRSEKSPAAVGISMDDETLLLASFRRALGEQVAEPTPAVGGEEGGGGAEVAFASALERFSEAVQGGTDDREAFHISLLGMAESPDVQAIGGDGAQFASYLADFLRYMFDNQLLDDIRIINILSNISTSLSVWASTPPDGRSGMLEDSLSLLRDFRSQFE